MLCVAALWSVTASLDKLGVLYGSLWVYLATQRIIIGEFCVLGEPSIGHLSSLLLSPPLLVRSSVRDWHRADPDEVICLAPAGLSSSYPTESLWPCLDQHPWPSSNWHDRGTGCMWGIGYK